MIQTIYPASYADQISIFDFNMRPGPSEWARPDCPPPYQSCAKGVNPRPHSQVLQRQGMYCLLPCLLYICTVCSVGCPALFALH